MKIVNPDGLDVERSWSVLSTTVDGLQYRTMCQDAESARAVCFVLNREPIVQKNLIVPPVDWSLPQFRKSK
jgi:hypothetical protein